MILTFGGILRAQQDRTGPKAWRVHLAFPWMTPSSNLLNTALPLLYHPLDPIQSYLTVSRLPYLIKLKHTEPAVTRARPHIAPTLLAQLHKIYPFVCLDLLFYKFL
jgi:hypothetical protein